MLSPDQPSESHRLHFVEKWSLRKIARHICESAAARIPSIWKRWLRRPLTAPANSIRSSRSSPSCSSKIPDANAPVIAQRLKPHGYDGGFTIIKDYLRTLRKNSVARRAYVRVEPAPGEPFDVDWGHFGALVYNGATRKLYAFCLVESHSRKMYLEFSVINRLIVAEDGVPVERRYSFSSRDFYSGGEGPALEFGSWERPTSRAGPPRSRHCLSHFPPRSTTSKPIGPRRARNSFRVAARFACRMPSSVTGAGASKPMMNIMIGSRFAAASATVAARHSPSCRPSLHDTAITA
jgi:hypothetical protein